MANPGLFRLFSLMVYRHFRQDPIRCLLTLLGVSLGIALVTAIRLSSGAVLSSFEESVDLMAGKANLTVRQKGVPFPEDWMARLVSVPKHGAVQMPVVWGKLAAAENPKDLLSVLGTDLLKDDQIRDYEVLGKDDKPLGRKDFLKILPEPDAIILSKKFALLHHLMVGDKASFLSGDQTKNLRVEGLLSGQGAGRALDGSFAVMDIAAAQETFGKRGVLDEIQWAVGKEADRAQLEKDLREKLPSSFLVERPSRRNLQVEKMLKAFHANLLALALVSLGVGFFLVYNSMSIAVLRHTRDLGLLRALGLTRAKILCLVLFEASAYGAGGAFLGLFLGKAMASGVLRLVGGTARDLYLFASVGSHIPGAGSAVLWAFLGALLVAASSIPPAYSASLIEPSLALRPGHVQARMADRAWILAAAGFLCLASGEGLYHLPPVNGLPLGGYAAAFFLLLGTSFLTPFFIRLLFGAAEKLAGSRLPLSLRLAYKNLVSGLGRTSVAVSALAMGVALLVSVTVMVGSFRETVTLWLGQTLRADLYLKPASDTAGELESLISPGTVSAIARTEGVQVVERLRGIQYPWKGGDLYLAAFDMNVLEKYGNLVFKTGGTSASLLDGIRGKKAVVISEPLELKERFKAGDYFPMETPSGPVSLFIRAVYFDYSNDQGTLLMDRAVYAKLFQDEGVNGVAVYLKPGLDVESARQKILAGLPPGTQVFARSNMALKKEVMAIFDRTFTITYAMEIIAVLVAVLGILTTLAALILGRKGEITMLRCLGATQGQVQTSILWEAGWMGILGIALGLGLGFLLALLLIYVINVQSFGWTIQWHVPWGLLARDLSWVAAATLLAGIYPARLALRVRSIREVNPE